MMLESAGNEFYKRTAKLQQLSRRKLKHRSLSLKFRQCYTFFTTSNLLFMLIECELKFSMLSRGGTGGFALVNVGTFEYVELLSTIVINDQSNSILCIQDFCQKCMRLSLVFSTYIILHNKHIPYR